ncbi:MAG: Uma2 family endonuclease [Chloroflexaceae bacterium]|jgi:Uma2 family endonuclease|nr:Uma2 family endonuclease [Chloroflexaceae bacterium]
MNESQAVLEEPAVQRSIADMDWVDPPSLPPTDLPYDDGEPMESPWHVGSGTLLKASYIEARGGKMDDFYVGVNMFVYYSWQQVRNKDFKGPDVYFVHDVDGQRRRLYWATWDEAGRYPDVIIEFLSESTEKEDLGNKKQIYERTFQAAEYFCVAPEAERLLGWRLVERAYTPITPNEKGWLWSKELNLWLGSWQGTYLGEEHTWPRFYKADGSLVLLPEEAAAQRAEAAKQQAEAAKQQAEAAKQQAEAAKQRAEAEAQRAEVEAQRAATEAQRAERFAARLRALGIDPDQDM